MVLGLEFLKPLRIDECCGFGGTFCIFEEAVSVKRGKDRIKEHLVNDFTLSNQLNPWYKQREIPKAPQKSFID